MLQPAPPSILTEYGIIHESDDALARPELPAELARLPDEDDATWNAREAKRAEAVRADNKRFVEAYIRAATETGDWSGLLVPGRTPTVFRVRRIGVTAWAAFKAEAVAQRLSEEQIAHLAFRLGVVGIDNLPLPVKLDRSPYVDPEGKRIKAMGDVLSTEVVDMIALADQGNEVVVGIGLLIAKQRGGPLGK